MKTRLIVMSVLLALSSAVTLARNAPMDQPARVEFVKIDGIAPSAERTRNAILQGASRFGWQVLNAGTDLVTLQYNKGNGKHIVTINVAYDANGFQIRYVDSTGMDYEVSDGLVEIHPNYNRWIANLGNEIKNRQMQVQ
ncbi:hypothetical protein [Chitinilyticum piscinae]|uniref:Lipoprotein n=1 Tax=Chitinilyticum piscinae TaxID=2866724 RepID=A0A8J7K0C6_9NEIS|nr:hypothetical protein [Chitinilyticum piscinae]MBE9607811.1 hypothetical protein [Chitinilyticum piscinae]